MPKKKSYLTVTDQFCGAGGSSLGAAVGSVGFQRNDEPYFYRIRRLTRNGRSVK